MKQFGIIKKGKLILNNKHQFNQQLIELEGKEVVIKIVERGNRRTNDQNSLFWKWVEIISNETGYTRNKIINII